METNTTEEKTTVENQALTLEKKAVDLPAVVRERVVEIVDQESLARANAAMRYIRDLRKAVIDIFDPIVVATRKAWKISLQKKKEVEDPINEAEGFVKGRIKVYTLKLLEKRWEAEEKERLRLKEIADKAEEEVQKAIALEEAGEKEKAEEVLEAAVVQVEEETKAAPVIIPEAPKVEAAVMRDHWVWTEVDFSKIPRRFLMLDRAKINTIVTRDKEKTDIPGIEAYNDPIVSHAREKK